MRPQFAVTESSLRLIAYRRGWYGRVGHRRGGRSRDFGEARPHRADRGGARRLEAVFGGVISAGRERDGKERGR